MPPRKKPKPSPPGLNQLVAQNLERIRKERGWSQDEVASRGWRVGLPWSRSTITALEGARRTLTVSELVLLALTLDTSVAELLAGRGNALLGDDTELSLSDVRALLSGNKEGADIRRRIHKARQAKYKRPMLAVNGEAEQKAARNLGVTSQAIADAAYDLWSQSLTEERDARLEEEGSHLHSQRSLQALRGHITRRLVREIESLITSNPDQFPTSEEDS